MQQRDRREQRRARDVADQHRAPRADARGDRAAPEAEHADRHDLGDDHPRHLLRRAGGAQHEPRQREPRHLRAERRDHLGAEQRRDATVAQQAHGSAAAPKRDDDAARAAPRRGRGTRRAAARSARRALRARAASARASRTRSASRAASAAAARARAAARRAARCCCRPTSSSRSTVASSPSEGNSIRDAVARHGRSRPTPPSASSTKPHWRARAGGSCRRTGCRRPTARALGRGRLLDRVQVVEQREPRRVGERAHRARVVRVSEFSKEMFRNYSFESHASSTACSFSRSSPAGGLARGLAALQPRRACRARSLRAARVRSPAASAGDRVDGEHSAIIRVVEPQRQLHPLADPLLDEEVRRRPRRSPRRCPRRRGTSRARARASSRGPTAL